MAENTIEFLHVPYKKSEVRAFVKDRYFVALPAEITLHITDLRTRVGAIESYIPSGASAQNQLVTESKFPVVELTGSSGTLTDTEYGTLLGQPRGLIVLSGEVYRYTRENEYFYYYSVMVPYTSSFYLEKIISITKLTHSWTRSVDNIVTQTYADQQKSDVLNLCVRRSTNNVGLLVYVRNNGVEDVRGVTNSPTANSIVQRTSDGQIKGKTPVANDDVANKGYADEKYLEALNQCVRRSTNDDGFLVYVRKAGVEGTRTVASIVTNDALVQRTSTGQIKGTTPVANDDVANKGYVDGAVSPKANKTYVDQQDNALGTRITTLENKVASGENYIGTFSFVPYVDITGLLPTDAEMLAFVRTKKGQSYTLVSGDMVICVQQVDDAEDHAYKYFYDGTTWSYYEIPNVIEPAEQDQYGTIKGSDNENLEPGDLFYEIVNGKITTIGYIDDDGDPHVFSEEIEDIKEQLEDISITPEKLLEVIEGDEFVTVDENAAGTKVVVSIDGDYKPWEVSLTGTSGTLSATNLAKVQSKLATIKLDNELYRRTTESTTYLYFGVISETNGTASSKTIRITKTGGAWTKYTTEISSSERGIGTFTFVPYTDIAGTMPTDEELEDFAETKISPYVHKTGDVIMGVQAWDYDKDHLYKFFFDGTTWQHYEIPSVFEPAEQDQLGLVRGGEDTDLSAEGDLYVEINGGKIEGLYYLGSDGDPHDLVEDIIDVKETVETDIMTPQTVVCYDQSGVAHTYSINMTEINI